MDDPRDHGVVPVDELSPLRAGVEYHLQRSAELDGCLLVDDDDGAVTAFVPRAVGVCVTASGSWEVRLAATRLRFGWSATLVDPSTGRAVARSRSGWRSGRHELTAGRRGRATLARGRDGRWELGAGGRSFAQLTPDPDSRRLARPTIGDSATVRVESCPYPDSTRDWMLLLAIVVARQEPSPAAPDAVSTMPYA